MSDIAIRVENLGKMYRIGAEEKRPDNLWQATKQLVASPFDYLRRITRPPTEEETLWALKDVSFEVKRGEVVGVIGRNGAGKSTLLKILSRITEPTHGRAEIHGRVGSLLEVGTGFHPELTGRENIYLNGAILGMKREEIDRKFDEMVDFSGVEKFIDTPVKRYSSGMRVRLAFSVAAHLDPEVLLIDEVLAVGDVEFQKKCLGKISEVAGEGRTVLFVSHNMAAIENLCDRTLLISEGVVYADGWTKLVIEEYLSFSYSLARRQLCERDDRRGTGRILFTSFEVQDGQRGKSGVLRSGSPAMFLLRYENMIGEALTNVVVALGIDNQKGQRITHISNEINGQIFNSVPRSNNAFRIFIDRLQLMPGRYKATVFCQVKGEIADWIQDAGYFDVEPGDYYGTGRLSPQTQGDFLMDYCFDY